MSLRLEAWIESTLGGRPSALSGEAVADCLSCGKEGHLYVNTSSGLAYCFRCGYSANLARLLRDVTGCSAAAAGLAAAALFGSARGADGRAVAPATPLGADEGDALREALRDPRRVAEEAVAVRLPAGCVPVFAGDPARPERDTRAAEWYLGWRRMGRAAARRYRVMYCPVVRLGEGGVEEVEDRRYQGQLIFPDFDEGGALRYFTTRRVDFQSGEGFSALVRSVHHTIAWSTALYFFSAAVGRPKSLHPPGGRAGGLLFGEWAMRDPRSLAFVVEGPMDMLALGGRAVALLGKHLSDAQAVRLAELGATVVLALDDDAGKEKREAGKTLLRAGVSDAYYVSGALGGDPADLAETRTAAGVAAYIAARLSRVDDGALLLSRLLGN